MGVQASKIYATFSKSSFVIPASTNKLPRLAMPSFSLKYSDYKNFIMSFTQTAVREHGVSKSEKFNHLLNCLHYIGNSKGVSKLKARYNNNSTLILMKNVATLLKLPDVSKSKSGQLRSLVDNTISLCSSLKSLSPSTDVVNVMLVYIVMKKLVLKLAKKWIEFFDFNKLLGSVFKSSRMKMPIFRIIGLNYHFPNARSPFRKIKPKIVKI